MKKLILIAVFGLIVFGASAGVSWMLRGQSTPETAEESEETSTSEAEKPAPAPSTAASASPSGPAAPAAAAGTNARPAGMPVAVHPRPMSIEELMRYGMGLNQRDEALQQREADMRAQELHIKLILADLNGEQETIDGLRTQVQSQLEAADALLQKLEASRTELAESRRQAAEDLKAAQEAQIEIEQQQRDNIKQTATWLQAMDPDQAAGVLKEMANDGRLENGVKILAQLEEREVAKILSALNDPKLVDQFIDRFQSLKRPPAKTAGKR